MSLAVQAGLALGIAKKNKKAIGLVVDGVLFMFKSVTKIEESETGKYTSVSGQLEGEIFKTLHRELNHWVQIDLQKVSAVIDRDHAGAVLDDQ